VINWIGLFSEVIVILGDVKTYSMMHIFSLADALATIVIVILITACPCKGVVYADVVYLKPDMQNSGSVTYVKILPDFINF
jgi:Ni,Fe-hydrogenase III small subunit